MPSVVIRQRCSGAQSVSFFSVTVPMNTFRSVPSVSQRTLSA